MIDILYISVNGLMTIPHDEYIIQLFFTMAYIINSSTDHDKNDNCNYINNDNCFKC